MNTPCTYLQARLTAFKEELDALELQLAHFTQSGSARESVRLKSELQQLSEKRDTFFEEYKKQAEDVFWKWIKQNITPKDVDVQVDTDGLLKVHARRPDVGLQGRDEYPFLRLIKEADVLVIWLHQNDHVVYLQRVKGMIALKTTIYMPHLVEVGHFLHNHNNILILPRLVKARYITITQDEITNYPSLKEVEQLYFYGKGPFKEILPVLEKVKIITVDSDESQHQLEKLQLEGFLDKDVIINTKRQLENNFI
ncbi:hypothetical protein HGA88_06650 [Candidatus Roizmanbacteria bacterium]|nr:hypothetical protein [Candidatus Roizmanbacteria bacterium]